MNYMGGNSPELTEIDDKYEDLYDELLVPIEPIRSSWQRRRARLEHSERPLPTQPKERTVILPFPHSGPRDIRAEHEARWIVAERSRDQLLDILQEVAEVALKGII